VGCLSQEYSTRVSRKSSSPGSTRTVSASGMARFAHRHGYQTDRAQACGRSGSSDGGIGLEERALQLLASTQGGNVLNTSFIERINGTFRERLASLTRRCRHASHSVEMLAAGMWLVGCTYNFCWPHHELSRQRKQNLTPAMASGLTDHPWSVRELLAHRIAPPPWQPPKRRGQPPKSGCPRQTPPVKRQTGLLRLRKGGLCPSTR
jgi:hypothetical protein